MLRIKESQGKEEVNERKMSLTWYEFVVDAWNRLWIRSETTLIILQLIVLLGLSSLIDRKVLTSFPIAWLFFDPDLLQTGLLNLGVGTLDHARRGIVLEIEQCLGKITKLAYIIE